MTSTRLAQIVEMKEQSTLNVAAASTVKACGEELYESHRDRALFRRSASLAALSLSGLLINMVLIGKRVQSNVTQILAEEPLAQDSGVEGAQIVVTVLSFACMFLIAESSVYEIRRQQTAELRALVGTDVELPPLPSLFSKVMVLMIIRRSIVEFLLHFPHAFPYLITEQFSRYFSVLMLARVYTLLRPLGYLHPSFARRFDIFGSNENRDRFPTVNVNWRTMIKMWFLDNTGIGFLVCFFATLFLCAFGVFVAEGDHQPEDFGQFKDCIWFIFVTAATIGYGDIIPETDLGRICAILSGMLGVILANMIAGILAVQFSKTASQIEIANFMEKAKRVKKVQLAAKSALVSFLRLGTWRRKHFPGVLMFAACKQFPDQLLKFRAMKEDCKELRKQQRLLEQTSTDDGQAAAEMGKLLLTAADLKARVEELQKRTMQMEQQNQLNQLAALKRMQAMQAAHTERVALVEQRLLEAEQQLHAMVTENTQLCREIFRQVKSTLGVSVTEPAASSARRGSMVMERSADESIGFAQQMALINVMMRKLSKGQEEILEKISNKK